MDKKILITFHNFDPVSQKTLKIVDYSLKKLNIKTVYFLYKAIINKESLFTKNEKIVLLNSSLPKNQEFNYIIEANSFSRKEYEMLDWILIFKKQFPKTEIYWLITSDQFEDWQEEKDFQLALSLIQLVFYYTKNNRGVLDSYDLLKNRIIYLKTIENIENIENSIYKIEKNNFSEIVINYINLSIECAIKRIKHFQTKDRFQHSMRVAGTVQKICELLDIKDKDVRYKVYIAALYHDLCKGFSKKYQFEIAEKKLNIDIKTTSWKVLHGPVASWYMKKFFLFTDEVILDAIEYHTIPKKDSNLISKILFVADKIELQKKDNFDEKTYLNFWQLIQNHNLEKVFEDLKNIPHNTENNI